MKIEKANSGEKTHGYILYGVIPGPSVRKWFERWFPSKFKAGNYAKKRGWEVEE